MEEENIRLKRMYSNLAIELDMSKSIMDKSFKALQEAKDFKRTPYKQTQRPQQGESYFKNK